MQRFSDQQKMRLHAHAERSSDQQKMRLQAHAEVRAKKLSNKNEVAHAEVRALFKVDCACACRRIKLKCPNNLVDICKLLSTLLKVLLAKKRGRINVTARTGVA